MERDAENLLTLVAELREARTRLERQAALFGDWRGLTERFEAVEAERDELRTRLENHEAMAERLRSRTVEVDELVMQRQAALDICDNYSRRASQDIRNAADYIRRALGENP